jgi:hypothetical protein
MPFILRDAASRLLRMRFDSSPCALRMAAYTGFSTTCNPSRGLGIGQICQSGL